MTQKTQEEKYPTLEQDKQLKSWSTLTEQDFNYFLTLNDYLSIKSPAILKTKVDEYLSRLKDLYKRVAKRPHNYPPETFMAEKSVLYDMTFIGVLALGYTHEQIQYEIEQQESTRVMEIPLNKEEVINICVTTLYSSTDVNVHIVGNAMIISTKMPSKLATEERTERVHNIKKMFEESTGLKVIIVDWEAAFQGL